MSYYKLKDRIFHHSEKFKELIESQDGVQMMIPMIMVGKIIVMKMIRFRLAHVERYSHMGLEVVHITCFPRECSKACLYLDLMLLDIRMMKRECLRLVECLWIGHQLCTKRKWHDTTWNKDRKLPVWATVFSKDFIAVRPTEDEYEKYLRLGLMHLKDGYAN